MIQSLSIASLLALLLSACSAENPPQALGTLERDRITFSATSNEIIRELPIAEGEHVKVGDVLVKLDSQIQTTLLTQASNRRHRTSQSRTGRSPSQCHLATTKTR